MEAEGSSRAGASISPRGRPPHAEDWDEVNEVFGVINEG
jgi:hypothetical protein